MRFMKDASLAPRLRHRTDPRDPARPPGRHPAAAAAQRRLDRLATTRRVLGVWVLAWMLALGLLLGLGLLQPARAQDRLPAAVSAALEAAQVPPDAFAAVALPMGGRETGDGRARHGLPWRHRAEVPMQPGSTMKLVTSVVALDRLGPNHRGHTALRSAAVLDGDVLRGDLVLQGGLDPDLGLSELWALLGELRAAGVREIAGDLWLDRSLVHPPRPDLGVPPFDEAPEFAYNVIPDALQLAGALLPLELRAGADGVSVRTVPALDGLTVSSRMTLRDPNPGAANPCTQWSRDWRPARSRVDADGSVHLELHGAFPRGCIQRTALQVIDRQWLTERVFATLWRQWGGTWNGRAREAAAPEGARVLARREARTWGEVLRPLNKVSDNAHTRMLYFALGAARAQRLPAEAVAADGSRTPTAVLAEREVREWFVAHRIDPAGLLMDNGSGLSRSERISPMQLARMLQVAHAGRHAPDLWMSLPVAGTDGTMRLRLREGPASGWARLKTGTLRNVVALAGWVHDDDGRAWAVVAMVNHDLAARARPALDAFVDWVARGGVHEQPRPLDAHGHMP